MIICGLSVYLILLAKSAEQVVAMSSVFGCFSTTAWNLIVVIQAEQYPTVVRSTAFGFHAAWGRLGAIIANVVFGELMESAIGITLALVTFFMFCGAFSGTLLGKYGHKPIEG